jgi:hypothetical protein
MTLVIPIPTISTIILVPKLDLEIIDYLLIHQIPSIQYYKYKGYGYQVRSWIIPDNWKNSGGSYSHGIY